MALARFPELRKLPTRQKLKLAEELWREAVDDSVAVSADDRALLDSRWKAYRAGKVERISLQELERRVAYVTRQSDPRTGYGDLTWALMNSSEFAMNH